LLVSDFEQLLGAFNVGGEADDHGHEGEDNHGDDHDDDHDDDHEDDHENEGSTMPTKRKKRNAEEEEEHDEAKVSSISEL